MRTKKQFIQALKKKRRNVYYEGQLIDRDDELQMLAIVTMAITFDMANDP